jgi:hypothetical protein
MWRQASGSQQRATKKKREGVCVWGGGVREAAAAHGNAGNNRKVGGSVRRGQAVIEDQQPVEAPQLLTFWW